LHSKSTPGSGVVGGAGVLNGLKVGAGVVVLVEVVVGSSVVVNLLRLLRFLFLFLFLFLLRPFEPLEEPVVVDGGAGVENLRFAKLKLEKRFLELELVVEEIGLEKRLLTEVEEGR